MVEVEIGQRQRTERPTGPTGLGLGRLIENAAVGRPGQRIGASQPALALDAGVQLGDQAGRERQEAKTDKAVPQSRGRRDRRVLQAIDDVPGDGAGQGDQDAGSEPPHQAQAAAGIR